MTTVISHFYNEEYLLPWWLDHHTRLFDHGILVDYNSTDRSVQICRQMAPNWEVRPSKNPYFSAIDCDREVMEIERECAGWKMILNTTEFFCCPNMSGFLRGFESSNVLGAFVRAVVMVDRPETAAMPLDPRKPLIVQRHEGFFEDEILLDYIPWAARSRLIHCYDDGAYVVGRHASSHVGLTQHPPGALVLWFGFAPWTPATRARKLQIQSRIPEADKQLLYGFQHLVDGDQLDAMWLAEAKKAIDLRGRSEYASVISGV